MLDDWVLVFEEWLPLFNIVVPITILALHSLYWRRKERLEKKNWRPKPYETIEDELKQMATRLEQQPKNPHPSFRQLTEDEDFVTYVYLRHETTLEIILTWFPKKRSFAKNIDLIGHLIEGMIEEYSNFRIE